MNSIYAPKPSDSELAKETSRSLASALANGLEQPFTVVDRGTGKEVSLPDAAVQAILKVLHEMGQGNVVSVTSIHAEISTQEAADLLNVSRTYLVKLVDENEIPSRKVGAQRRLMLTDVLAYKQEMYAKQLKGMQELVELSEELGLYDNEV